LASASRFKLDRDGLRIGSERRPVPKDSAELFAALRHALARSPRPVPDIPGVPPGRRPRRLRLVRHRPLLRETPTRSALDSAFPVLHYAATKSLLVFDHSRAAIALLHDGSEVERQALRKEVIQALRGALPNGRHAGKYSRPEAGSQRRRSHGRRGSACRNTSPPATCISSCSPSALAAGMICIRFEVYRALRFHQSLAVHVLLRARGRHGGGLFRRSAGEN